MAPPPQRTIAVLFATKGGMGDVGKFAALQASQAEGVQARVVALRSSQRDGEEGEEGEVDVDIAQPEPRAELKAAFAKMAYKTVDVDGASAQAEVEAALQGAHAVVACVGSRQAELGRWCGDGARMVVRAMKARGVARLVLLSSMGIGEDFQPVSVVRVGWALLLGTVWRAVRKDLEEMETAVSESGLEYLIVRPMGLTPGEAARGSWKVVTSWGEAGLRLSVAKADVAAFMVQEAVAPTLSKRAVTIGQARD